MTQKGISMVGVSFGFILAYGLVIGGEPVSNELLDYVQTEAYWNSRQVSMSAEDLIKRISVAGKPADISPLVEQLGSVDFQTREEATAAIAAQGPAVIPQLQKALQSDDAEVVRRVKGLLQSLTTGNADTLMAIRTLGELKSEAALPALEKLTAAKEPFVAAYARRAIASIKGEEIKPQGLPAETWEKDLWMLPKDCNIVGQLSLRGFGPFQVEEAFKQLPPPIVQQKGEILTEMNQAVITALNIVGNIRIDGATFGVVGNMDQQGYAMVILRGQYDRKQVLQALTNATGAESRQLEGAVAVQPDPYVNLLMPSNEVFILLASGRTNAPRDVEQFTQKTLAAFTAGQGGLPQNAAMVKLIKSVPKSNGAWGVVQVTDSYRQEVEWLAPFDTLIASRKTEQGLSKFRIECQGKEADAVQAVADQVNAELEQARQQLSQAGALVPPTVVDAVRSLKVNADGTQAVLSGAVKADQAALISFFAGMGIRTQRVEAR